MMQGNLRQSNYTQQEKGTRMSWILNNAISATRRKLVIYQIMHFSISKSILKLKSSIQQYIFNTFTFLVQVTNFPTVKTSIDNALGDDN